MLDLVHRTLPNGLRVVLIDLPHVHSVSCAFMVRAGPRFERPEENGLSHLVEHLLFRGTRARPSSLAYHVAVEDIGGEVNGLTQRDATTIHMTVTPSMLRQGLDLLGEICIEPLLAGLEVERDVVLEEILDSTDSEGHDLDIDSISRKALWAPHPVSMPVAGDAELLESFTEQHCRAFFERTFVAKNAVLAVAGRLDDGCLGWIEAAFGRMPAGERLPDPPAPRARELPPIHVQPTDDSQVSMLLTLPAPSELDPDFGTMLLLRRVLDDGFGSRLRQAICEQRGLAYSLSVGLDAYQDAGALDVEVTCAPRKLYAVVEQVLVTLKEVREAPIRDEELRRVKTRHQADLTFGLDDPSEIAGWYGASELIGSALADQTRQDAIMALTPEDIRQLAQRIVEPSRMLLTVLGPTQERTLRRLEKLLGRPAESTVVLGETEDADETSSGPVLVAS